MPYRLRIEPVQSAIALRRCLSPGNADEYGEVDDDELIVDAEADAKALVDNYPNVGWAADGGDESESVDEQVTRANVDTDGASYECGVNGCSRAVDSRDDVCWQHESEES